MNFTNRRFSRPSSCEYQRLEEDISPMKERPEPKPILEVKRRLISFQRAQEEEKWPQNLGVMDFTSQPICSASNGSVQPHFGPTKSNHEEASTEAIYYVKEGLLGVHIKKNQARSPIQPEEILGTFKLPKPIKPISFMESLQPIQFGPSQTYLWKPGDTLDHPEGLQEVLSCTSTQEIRRIFICTNLPYLAAFTLLALKEFLQGFYQDQRPYSPSRHFLCISGRLLNHGIVQKLSRYKIFSSFPFEDTKSS